MKKIGIFGGTFNPPHIAHLIHSEIVRTQVTLDKIIFIPSGNPPLKESGILDSLHRLKMTKIAFESDENFLVSDIEITDSADKSYTIDTLHKFRKLYNKSDIKLYLIIGLDNLIDFPKWKSPEKIFTLSEVLVMNRPGYSVNDVPDEFSKKVTYISVPSLEISSTMIRERIKAGKSVKYLVTEPVLKYINENKLYI